MTEPLQPGSHLSPDQLSAFVENALPEHERLAALTHLADCNDCRRIVFLTQQADPTLAAAPAAETLRRGWFTLPQILVAASAALACTLILALILHFHPAQTTSPVTTANVEIPPPMAPAAPPATPAPQKSTPTPQPTSPARLSTAAAHSPAEPPISATLPAKIVPRPAVPQPPAYSLGGSYHGTISGSDHRDSTNSDESRMRSQQYVGAGSGTAANGALLANATPKAPAAVSGAATPQPAPAPAQPALRQSAMDAKANSIIVSGANIDGLPLANRDALDLLPLAPGVAQPLELPSKKPVASQLSAANRILALDTAGTLFITYDHGQHWTAVAPQWSGKAVQLSLATAPARLYQVQPQQQTQAPPTGSYNGSVTTAAPQTQQIPIPTATFELTTATGVVFVSTDGLTWRPR